MSEVKQLTWTQAIEQTQDRFLAIAPVEMKFEKEKGFAVQLLKNNDYLMKVAQAHPQSLQQALTNVASIGLSLNPAEKQAYLIPRAVKSGDKYVTKIFLEPSYMGLIKLATDSGSIKWVQAFPVYAEDTFEFIGVGEKPNHKFNPFAPIEKRGDFIGVYCVAKTADSDYLVNMMASDQVLSIRDRSEAWKSFKAGKVKTGGPWETDFIQQAKKTVIRQAFNTWPRSDLNRLAAAVHLSNENEGFEPILTSPELAQTTTETKEYFDQLISKNDALNMFVLQCQLNKNSDGAFTTLYHSFEKGQKGKYQKIVDDLISQGFAIVRDIRDAFVQMFDSGDDLGMKELLEGLSADAIEVVCDALKYPYNEEFRKIGESC